MSDPGNQMKLKEWLIAQVESGQYPGLMWDNMEKTIFRIPWKHAAKHDYREQADAALFKAWAIYKGKHQEGTDKADPSTWKTRLRCALNKSSDFEEIADRSQLDLSEPYKVYRVLTEAHRKPEDNAKELLHIREKKPSTPPAYPNACVGPTYVPDRVLLGPGLKKENTEGPGVTRRISPELPRMQSKPSDCDFWLHIRLYYQDVLVKEFTTRTMEGCRITHQAVPAEDEQLYGPSSMEQLPFPSPRVTSGCRLPEVTPILERLLPHLDRGVLLWVAPQGVFAKRQCQGRVYWSGPLAPNADQPNKLEREKTYKLLDTQRFLQELRVFLRNGEPAPRYQIRLCFGEEYPDVAPQTCKKLITAHVEPVFARELFLHAQQIGSQVLLSTQPGGSGASDSIIHILRQLCRP